MARFLHRDLGDLHRSELYPRGIRQESGIGVVGGDHRNDVGNVRYKFCGVCSSKLGESIHRIQVRITE